MKNKYFFVLILSVVLFVSVTLTKTSSVTGQVTVDEKGRTMQQILQERRFENLPAIAASQTELAPNLTENVEQLNRFGRKNAPFVKRSSFVVKPDRVNNFVRLVSEMAVFTTGKDNPTFFRLFQNIEQLNQFTLFEEWQNSTSFEQHLATSHAQKFFSQTSNLTENPVQVRLYRNASEPAQGDGTLNRSLVEAQPPAKPTAAKTLARLEQYGMAQAQFVLLVDVPVKQGGAAIMKDTAIRVQKATLQEPDSIRYGYYQDLETPTSFLLFEWWRDFAAMQRHVELPHFQELMKTFAAIGGDKRTVSIYRPLPF